MTFAIEFTPEAVRHLRQLSPPQRVRVRDALLEQLTHAPHLPTRNRGPMRPNTLAGYRLRVGNLRVYYDVEEFASRVLVKAIGIKVRNRVWIGGEELEL